MNEEQKNMYGSVMRAHVGHSVPDLEFEYYQDGDFHKAKISDYRKKWLILFFYPADFTFVCPTELEEMQNAYELFKAEGAEIISVSTDTVFTHKAWHDHSEAIKGIKYPMAADPTGQMSMTFDTYIENEGMSLRGTFVIDPEGILKLSEINDNSIGRSAEELLRKVKAAKFVAENEGLVCPASWKPGEDTLKPGADLVGKI